MAEDKAVAWISDSNYAPTEVWNVSTRTQRKAFLDWAYYCILSDDFNPTLEEWQQHPAYKAGLKGDFDEFHRLLQDEQLFLIPLY